MQQTLEPDFVGSELGDLRTDVHVETEQSNVREGRGNLGNGKSFIEGNPELHSFLAGPGVGMRRIDEHFGIYAQRDRRGNAETTCHFVENDELLLGLDVDEEHARAERLLHLASGLADATENDVAARVAGFQRPKQLAAGHDIETGPELAEQRENGDARVGFYAVVETRIQLVHRVAQ